MTTLLATFKNVRVFLILISSIAFAQTQTITQSASDFLITLDANTKAKTIFALSDPERFNWYFVPREKREGACFKYFNIEQRQAALSFLRTALSEAGYRKATEIMALESVLREIENRSKDDTHRDPLNYYFTFFGNPSEHEPWAWRIEGHHFVINFAIDKGLMVSGTPAFFGSNPGIVLQGEERGKQILKLETNLAFALVNSLTPDQKTKVVFAATALPEIITGNNRKAVLLSPVGIPYTELTPQQKQMFDQLLNTYVSNYELGFSKALMDKIKKAGLENLSFAWAGSFTLGVGNYYRIQGPMLLIEYDNTQNNANHVHTTVRDLTNDFAEDILREHYQNEHK